MRLTNFKALTFDCYGTLVDWESGLLSALRPWRAAHELDIEEDAVLAAFADAESLQEKQTPTAPYRDILAGVMKRLGTAWHAPVSDSEARAFGLSVGAWPPFPDTVDALAYLKRHFRLMVLSNVDNENFRATQAALGITFDAVHTAEDIGSYKPDPRNFAYLVEHLAADGIGKGEVLHVAQSLYHDHVPAQRAGLATCWIDRRAGRGGGATKSVEGARYDMRFTSLGALADAHRAEAPPPRDKAGASA